MQPAPPVADLDLEAIAARLAEVTAACATDPKEFRESVNVPYHTMRPYLSGLRAPSPELLAAMYRVFGISPAWVLTGDGEMRGESCRYPEASDQPFAVHTSFLITEPSPPQIVSSSAGSPYSRGSAIPTSGRSDSEGDLLADAAEAVRPLVLSVVRQGRDAGQEIRFQVIPKRIRPAAAGVGTQASAEHDGLDPIGDMAFTFDWLRRTVGRVVGMLSSVEVRGDSMEPTLIDGDTILVDEGINRVDEDGIYVLEIRGRRVVKRVQHFVDGTMALISDNPAYQRETVTRSMARDVLVLGRMVWPRGR